MQTGKSILMAGLVMAAVSSVVFRLSEGPQASVLAATTVSLSGMVRDEGGQPLRGARITVATEKESISRFADGAGRYKIENINAGPHQVSATAWGYEVKNETRELSADAEMNFRLAPQWDPRRLSSADWLSALPENEETLTLRASCIRCHNLSYIVRRRGLNEPLWTNLVANMGEFGDMLRGLPAGAQHPSNMFEATPEVTGKIGGILAKYFGRDSAIPTREQVRRPALSDAALRATFREYKAPARAYIHSVMPDNEGKYVWFTYFGQVAGTNEKLGRFEIATGELREIHLPAGASTMQISKDSRKVWVSGDGKLYQVDARTGEYTTYTPPIRIGRTMADGEDSAGNIWLAGNTIAKFDPRTQEFEEFEIPKVAAPAKDYERNVGNVREEGQKEFWSRAYALAVDSQDNVWYTAYDVGYLARLNPKTKETKMYEVPNAIMIKGITVGPDDTVWAGDFVAGTLVKLDPKTGRMEHYRPPTRYAEFYTPVVAKDGKVWLSDFSGSQMTRFDPATKEFTEYPLPAADGMVRFFGLDPQGKVWYVDFDTATIGVLDPGGV
jgi:streptogramin lyase